MIKKAILLFSLILVLLSVCNAQTQTKEIKAKGIFSEIEVEKHNETIKILQNKDKKKKKLTIDTILKNRILFFLSSLF